MKRKLVALFAALLATVTLSGCFWEHDRHRGDRDRDRDNGQMHDHDRDRDHDGDRH